MTAAEPARAEAFLRQWRPLVDEVIVAVDERADPETTAACGELADAVFRVPPAMANMEPYLGWLHARCSGEWILRADDDELPSEALREALPALLDEREPTHYWLPRRWIYPTPDTYVDEGIWLRDIQLRLVRNLPGLWRFSGQLHSNIEVEGAGRVLDAPLLHLALLVADLDERRAKVDAYENVPGGVGQDPPALLNAVFVPEDAEVASFAPSPRPDVLASTRYLDSAQAQAPRSGAAAATVVSRAEIDRWNGGRSVSPGAYRVRVELPFGVEPTSSEAIQHVQVEITNLGDEWLPRGPRPEPPIQVGYRWWREDGTEIVLPTLRTPFSETVAPGQATRLTMAIQAPPDHGRLRLQVDVVHELVRWFGCEKTLDVEVAPPYTEAFFAGHDAGGRASAEAVIPRVLELLAPEGIVDVGCGTGTWLRVAAESGVGDILGIDGPWVTADELEIPQARFLPRDLTSPLDIGRTFDLVVSLEVAEHLPPADAEYFVEQLTDLGDLVIFSAAVPGQGGSGHTNEQWPGYWSELFERRGHEAVDCLREVFWNDERVDWWYSQNLMVFGRPEAIERVAGLRDHPRRGRPPLPLIHPRRLGPG